VEALKRRPQLREDRWLKRPEIHGTENLGLHFELATLRPGADEHFSFPDDAPDLLEVLELHRSIDGADRAIDPPAVRKGRPVELVAREEMPWVSHHPCIAESANQSLDDPRPVEIVRVQHQERLADHPAERDDGVTGSPRRLPIGGWSEPGGNVVDPLGDDHDVDGWAESGGNLRLEELLIARGRDEYDSPAPGPNGVVDGILEQRLAAGPHGLELLRPSESRRSAGCEDREGH
jgi:hypothetical protein